MTLDQETAVERILSEEARLIEEGAMIGDVVKTHENARLNLTTAIAGSSFVFFLVWVSFRTRTVPSDDRVLTRGRFSNIWNLYSHSKNGLAQ